MTAEQAHEKAKGDEQIILQILLSYGPIVPNSKRLEAAQKIARTYEFRMKQLETRAQEAEAELQSLVDKF